MPVCDEVSVWDFAYARVFVQAMSLSIPFSQFILIVEAILMGLLTSLTHASARAIIPAIINIVPLTHCTVLPSCSNFAPSSAPISMDSSRAGAT